MKKIILGHLLLLVILCAASGRLYASSLLAGRMASVGPYGAQDTARNPALLSFQDSNNTLGFTATYQAIPSADIDITQFQPIRVTADYDAHDAGSARLSYARTINRLTLGFDYYFNMQASAIHQSILTYKGNFVVGQGAMKEHNMANLFTFALSAAVDSSHALGLRLNCSYINNQRRDSTRYLQVSLPPVYVQNKESTVFEEASTLPCLGYFGKIGVSEIGLMVTPGKFSWKKMGKKALTYDLSSILAQVLFKADGELPFWFSYNMGPTVIAGFHTRPSFNSGLGFEMEFSIPVAYRDPFLIGGDKLPPIPYVRLHYFSSGTFGLKNRVLIKPSLSIRAGGEFAVSRTAVFSLGAGFGYNASPYTATGLCPAPLEMFYSDYRIISVLGTAGFDFLIGKNSTLTIGAAVTYYTLEQKEALREALSMLANEFKTKNVILDLTASASISF